MPLTVADLMSKMPGAFIPEKAAGLDAAIQFKFTGAEPGEWNAVIKDGKVEVQQGAHPNPRMTLTADSGDYVKIFTGELDGMKAFIIPDVSTRIAALRTGKIDILPGVEAEEAEGSLVKFFLANCPSRLNPFCRWSKRPVKRPRVSASTMIRSCLPMLQKCP